MILAQDYMRVAARGIPKRSLGAIQTGSAAAPVTVVPNIVESVIAPVSGSVPTVAAGTIGDGATGMSTPASSQAGSDKHLEHVFAVGLALVLAVVIFRR